MSYSHHRCCFYFCFYIIRYTSGCVQIATRIQIRVASFIFTVVYVGASYIATNQEKCFIQSIINLTIIYNDKDLKLYQKI